MVQQIPSELSTCIYLPIVLDLLTAKKITEIIHTTPRMIIPFIGRIIGGGQRLQLSIQTESPASAGHCKSSCTACPGHLNLPSRHGFYSSPGCPPGCHKNGSSHRFYYYARRSSELDNSGNPGDLFIYFLSFFSYIFYVLQASKYLLLVKIQRTKIRSNGKVRSIYCVSVEILLILL